MNSLMLGLVMASSAFLIALQVPHKKLWMRHLWVLDLAVFIGLFWLAVEIRSTAIATSGAIAGVAFTVFIHSYRVFYRAIKS